MGYSCKAGHSRLPQWGLAVTALRFTLEEGEDRAILGDLVQNVSAWLEDGRAELLDHAHLADPADQRNHFVRPEPYDQRLAAIAAGTAKRFVIKVDSSAGPRVVKFFTPLGYANRLLYAVRASPSQRAHELAQQTMGGPLLLPHSYGYIDLRDDRSLVRSGQVMEHLAGLTSLGSYLTARLRSAGSNPAERLEAIHWLADHLAAMHRAGLYHPDLKPYHVFVVSTGDTERLLVIDMDRARVESELDEGQRATNLYQLYRYALYDCSESERFRLIERYVERHETEGLDAEDLYRRVLRIFKKKTERDAG